MNKEFYIDNNESLVSKFEFLNQVPGIIGVKDISLRCQSISTIFAKFLGWKTAEEAIGKNDFEVPSKAAESAELFIQSDSKAIKLNKQLTVISICNYADGLQSILSQKLSIKDSSDNVIGLFVTGIDVTRYVIKKYEWLDRIDSKYIKKISKARQYILTPEACPLPISSRQQECLALLIRGKGMKEIAFILGISTRTVETHFENIKYKLECYNKSQLIEKAIDSGFLFHIPERIFDLKLLSS